MIETYREEGETHEAEFQLRQNAILDREEILENGAREEMESLMDDEDDDELENISDNYANNEII